MSRVLPLPRQMRQTSRRLEETRATAVKDREGRSGRLPKQNHDKNYVLILHPYVLGNGPK